MIYGTERACNQLNIVVLFVLHFTYTVEKEKNPLSSVHRSVHFSGESELWQWQTAGMSAYCFHLSICTFSYSMFVYANR